MLIFLKLIFKFVKMLIPIIYEYKLIENVL